MFAVGNWSVTRRSGELVAGGALVVVLAACSGGSVGPATPPGPVTNFAAVPTPTGGSAPKSTLKSTAKSKGKPRPTPTSTPTGTTQADVRIRAAASAVAAVDKAASLAAAVRPEGTPGQ